MTFHSGQFHLSASDDDLRMGFISLGVVLATLLARGFLAHRFMCVLEKLAGKPEKTFSGETLEALRPGISLMILVAGVWVAVAILPFPERNFHFHRLTNTVAAIGLILIFGWVLFRLTSVFTGELNRKAQDPDYWLDSHLVPGISIGLKSAIVVGMLVAVTDTLGYSVSAIAASLGIGGIAVALAAKDTLANFFGSVTVMIDKPFRPGELIKGEGFEGAVEEIGFRSTRIRTADKTVKVVPNEKFTSMIIENIDRRKDVGLNMRRVNFTLGVEYSTSAAKIERAVEELRTLLRENSNVVPEPLEVHFTEFGELALNIGVNYFINTTVQHRYMQIRQEIHLAMMRKMEELGLRVAYPTRTIHLDRSGDMPAN